MRIATWLVGVPVVVVTVAFAVANRHDVTLSLDPLPWAAVAPLYLVVIAAFLAGLLVAAGIGMWRLSRARAIQRRLRRDVERLERDLASARDKLGNHERGHGHAHEPIAAGGGALVVVPPGKAA